MVLHLLGKKGWNVHNADNVERVRRDEAEARAREEAREQRMQDEDAARRLAILRGEEPPELIAEDEEDPNEARPRSNYGEGRPRKRRRLKGEDDTDAEIRHARQDVTAGEHVRSTLTKPGNAHEEAPLLDHAGHLQLIPAPDEKAARKAGKNAEAEAEKAKKREREEQRSNMRFADAAGYSSSVQSKPWYATGQAASQDSQARAIVLSEAQDKDVWGNADPARKEREAGRISKSDPFAAMQQAQRQLKQSERDRERWRREREAEVESVRRREQNAAKRERRREQDDVDSLDGFQLDDAPPGRERERIERRDRRRERLGSHKHRHRHRHKHHHRQVSRSRSPRRSRERRRSTDD